MVLKLYPISLIASYKFCLSKGKEIDLHTYTETKEKSPQPLQNADILITTYWNILAQFNKGRIKNNTDQIDTPASAGKDSISASIKCF